MEEQNIRKKSENGIDRINKRSEYNAFVTWCSIPANYRGLDNEKLLKLGIAEEQLELFSITTQTQFSEKYNLEHDTLTNWKKRSHFNSDLKDRVDTDVFQQNYSRLVKSFTAKTIKEGDAARVKLWNELYAGHIERQEVDVNVNEKIDVDSVMAGQDIMDIIAGKLIKSGRVSKDRLNELSKEVEDVEFEELPSQQQYDFDSMEVKTSKKVDNTDNDIKSKIAESLAKIKKKK